MGRGERGGFKWRFTYDLPTIYIRIYNKKKKIKWTKHYIVLLFCIGLYIIVIITTPGYLKDRCVQNLLSLSSAAAAQVCHRYLIKVLLLTSLFSPVQVDRQTRRSGYVADIIPSPRKSSSLLADCCIDAFVYVIHTPSKRRRRPLPNAVSIIAPVLFLLSRCIGGGLIKIQKAWLLGLIIGWYSCGGGENCCYCYWNERKKLIVWSIDIGGLVVVLISCNWEVASFCHNPFSHASSLSLSHS